MLQFGILDEDFPVGTKNKTAALVTGESVRDAAHGHYLWHAGSRTLAGGILVFSGEHVRLPDTPSGTEQAAWISALDDMAALPAVGALTAWVMVPVSPTAHTVTRYQDAGLVRIRRRAGRG
jgi:hypothetical protein